ncbi:hypothetical protein DEU56DRAFT_979748 [Suillus clintonianus]|uniref:uncharacterized protein n=1 Tax=Suillus clintonianus TaxID=1904413 RepID=UPI001B87A9A0|nr:uncharacterized protein DEU56DRAFT_979748 [Suillus clintonianus]KAG2141957.1 hypothetical protein DEU56DRAFT_979748 [Suillus clintonianus]
MRFTSQFVAFTGICVIIALVLPPPADAAYIASHPIGNRVSTAYQADKPRSIFSFPSLTAGHDPHKSSESKGKANVNTPSSRFFRFSDSDPLNPLAGVQDFSFAHVRSDDVHPPFSPRDASTRRPTPLSRRSSALVHGTGGNNYLVSRGAASSNISGIIDIVSGDQGRHLASLALDSLAYNSTNTTSTNSTSGHASNGSFPLNASSTNGTQFYLVDANDNSFDNPANATKHVMVQTNMFNSLYCATFDPNPSGPEPMMMEMCNPSPSENDVRNLDYSYNNGMAPIVDYTILATDPHKSQIFEYNPSTGVIKPMWTNSDGSTSSHAMFVERDSTNTSSTSAPQPTPSSSAPEAQNVTLVFRPSDHAVSAPPPSTDAAESSADDVVTTTITTTVVYTATATPSSSSSSAAGSPVAAIAALTMTSSSCSSMPTTCNSTSTSTPSPAIHAAAAAPSSAGSLSSKATPTGPAPIQPTSSLMPPSPSVHAAIAASIPGSLSSQATSTVPATTAQPTSSSIPPSPSVHADIVASSPGSSSSQATSTGSATTTQATSTSQPVSGSLEIEFVPIAGSPSSASITSSSPSSSSSSSTSSAPSTSSTSSSPSTTPSRMNAAAIASEIANSHSNTSTTINTNTSSASASSTAAPTTTTK